jgi:uncharacterized protein (TIGR02588 family)
MLKTNYFFGTVLFTLGIALTFISPTFERTRQAGTIKGPRFITKGIQPVQLIAFKEIYRYSTGVYELRFTVKNASEKKYKNIEVEGDFFYRGNVVASPVSIIKLLNPCDSTQLIFRWKPAEEKSKKPDSIIFRLGM